MSMKHWWNYTDNGKPKNSDENLSHASAMRGGRLATWIMARYLWLKFMHIVYKSLVPASQKQGLDCEDQSFNAG
jgi:hypothetical protein